MTLFNYLTISKLCMISGSQNTRITQSLFDTHMYRRKYEYPFNISPKLEPTTLSWIG